MDRRAAPASTTGRFRVLLKDPKRTELRSSRMAAENLQELSECAAPARGRSRRPFQHPVRAFFMYATRSATSASVRCETFCHAADLHYRTDRSDPEIARAEPSCS